MLPYLNKTYCDYWRVCKDGSTCPKALTPSIKRMAANIGVLPARYLEHPACFEKK